MALLFVLQSEGVHTRIIVIAGFLSSKSRKV